MVYLGAGSSATDGASDWASDPLDAGAISSGSSVTTASGAIGVTGAVVSFVAEAPVDSCGDDDMTVPSAKGDGPRCAEGSEASAAASLIGLSAIGLGAIWLPFAGGDNPAVSSCLIDAEEELLPPRIEPALTETESESRSCSEGLGDDVRATPGMLNAVEDRRTRVPTRFHREDFFGVRLGGGEPVIDAGGEDMVKIVDCRRC